MIGNDMTFLEHRAETVCFTGHRPDKFLDEVLYSEDVTIGTVRTLTTMITADAYQRGARYFITGMAQGVDLWAGQALLYMQRFLPDIHIIAAVPFRGQIERTKKEARAELLRIQDAADAVIYVSERYEPYAFLQRNDYMLRHASTLLAVQHAESGGTAYTIKNAARYGTKKRILDLRDYRMLISLLERYPDIYRMELPSQQYAFWQKYPRLIYQSGLLQEE